MSWILVRNKGEMERDALILMGASTKRDEVGKIGFFGTGVKYALAVLLRNQVPVRIWAGDRELLLEAEPVMLRGHEFRRLVVRDGLERHPTSVTLDVGPTWTVWMAVREILANAVDEGLVEVTETEHPDGAACPGTTAVCFEKVGPVEEVWRTKDEIVRLDTPAAFECKAGRILQRFGDDATRIYKNRVLVGKYEGILSLWDYDLLEVPLTEDRRVDMWNAAKHAQAVVAQSPEAVKQVIDWVSKAQFGPRPSVFEKDMVSSWHRPDKAWVIALEDNVLTDPETAKWAARDIVDLHLNVRVLPQEWIDTLRRTYPEEAPKTLMEALKKSVAANEVPPETVIKGDKEVLARAVSIMARENMKVTCPIAAVEFKDQAVLGRWDEKAQKILIAKRVLSEGVALTLEVLIEEYAHKESGMADCTRGFQTYLVKLLVKSIRRRRAM